MYWAFAPTAGYASYIARHSQKNISPIQLFHASGPDIRRLSNSIPAWQKDFRDFENWMRLAALLSAASYFEIYMRMVITCALLSDPLARFGKPRVLDGVIWLKHGMVDDFSSIVRSCVQGDWRSRLEHYKNLFGTVPTFLTQNMSELEALRKQRNNVGHAFGRNLTDHIDPLAFEAEPPTKLKEEKFKETLALIEQSASAIDAHLHRDFIGEFEALLFYHRWRNIPRSGRHSSLPEERALSRSLAIKLTQSPPGRDFCKELIDFYKKA